eukprot:g79063.t1
MIHSQHETVIKKLAEKFQQRSSVFLHGVTPGHLGVSLSHDFHENVVSTKFGLSRNPEMGRLTFSLFRELFPCNQLFPLESLFSHLSFENNPQNSRSCKAGHDNNINRIAHVLARSLVNPQNS